VATSCAVEGLNSFMVFHCPHPPHLPLHFGVSYPHSVHTKAVSFARSTAECVNARASMTSRSWERHNRLAGAFPAFSAARQSKGKLARPCIAGWALVFAHGRSSAVDAPLAAPHAVVKRSQQVCSACFNVKIPVQRVAGTCVWRTAERRTAWWWLKMLPSVASDTILAMCAGNMQTHEGLSCTNLLAGRGAPSHSAQ